MLPVNATGFADSDSQLRRCYRSMRQDSLVPIPSFIDVTGQCDRICWFLFPASSILPVNATGFAGFDSQLRRCYRSMRQDSLVPIPSFIDVTGQCDRICWFLFPASSILPVNATGFAGFDSQLRRCYRSMRQDSLVLIPSFVDVTGQCDRIRWFRFPASSMLLVNATGFADFDSQLRRCYRLMRLDSLVLIPASSMLPVNATGFTGSYPSFVDVTGQCDRIHWF